MQESPERQYLFLLVQKLISGQGLKPKLTKRKTITNIDTVWQRYQIYTTIFTSRDKTQNATHPHKA